MLLLLLMELYYREIKLDTHSCLTRSLLLLCLLLLVLLLILFVTILSLFAAVCFGFRFFLAFSLPSLLFSVELNDAKMQIAFCIRLLKFCKKQKKQHSDKIEKKKMKNAKRKRILIVIT